MQPVRTAIVGLGMMGSIHARILAASPAAELVVACDTDPSAAEQLPEGVDFTGDIDEALDRPGLEALVLATPQTVHRVGDEAGLARGLSVLCEKPMAATLDDADAIVEAGSGPDAHLVIGHMYRFDPRYQAIARAVRGGELGRPIQLSARGNVPDFEGHLLAHRTSLALENLVHSLDLMQWMAGPIVRVYGEASSTDVMGPGVVDSIAVTVRFDGGAVGILATGWNMPSGLGYASEQFFSVMGSEGLAWVDARDNGSGIVGPSGTSFPATISYDDPHGVPYGVYRTEVEAFLRSVREREPWPVSLVEARSAMAVAVAIDAAIESGGPVNVPTEAGADH